MEKASIELVLREAEKGMGFVPNSLPAMGVKPNILGAFAMLAGNIRGFSTNNVSPWTGAKLIFTNIRWMLYAKRNTHLEVPTALKDLVAHVSSNAAGCRYCQAHTAHTAHKNGVPVEKLQKVWEFQTSDLFSEAERAALDFAYSAGMVPNQVTPEHHEKLRQYFTPAQIVEIVATVAIFGFLNRWNDSMATPLEQEPMEFASKHLGDKWQAGKHQK